MSDATMPKPLYVTYSEGEGLTPFEEHRTSRRYLSISGVFAVFFDDGSIFDSICGWRNGPNPNAHHLHPYRCHHCNGQLWGVVSK